MDGEPDYSGRVGIITHIDDAGQLHGTWGGCAVIPTIDTIDSTIDSIEETKKTSYDSDMIIERKWAMPNKNTFDIKPIHELILSELTDGLWIDPFANKNKLAKVTNDLNPAYDTDYHLDALDFLKLFDDNSVDGVLYDPPYSPRQVSECYNDVGYNVTWDTTKASFWSNHKREISRIVKKGGKVITFGWNSGGIGTKYGFEITRILMVPHGGWHNDTICTVEVKTRDYINEDIPTKKQDENSMNNITEQDSKLVLSLASLPENYWDFAEEDTKEYTHAFHNYPAMMVCPISRNIIRLVKEVRPIEALLDPFAGSGTVLVEGMLAGIPKVSGNDINPLALMLCRTKTRNLNTDRLQKTCEELLNNINKEYSFSEEQIEEADSYFESAGYDLTAKNGWGTDAYSLLTKYIEEKHLGLEIGDFKNMGFWFKPRVLLLLSLIKRHINKIEDTNEREFAFIALSESIRLVSNRRNGEFKMYRMPAEKVARFKPDVIKEFTTILNRNIEKQIQFNKAIENLHLKEPSKVQIYRENSTQLSTIEDDVYDLIITSPPYGDSRTTVAYGEYSRLSLQMINLNHLQEQEILGIDKSLMGGKKYPNGFEFLLPSPTLKAALEAIKDKDIQRAGDVFSFYDDLDKVIQAVGKKTKKDGYQFWVVGNRTVKNVFLETDKILAELAEAHGFIHLYTSGRNIPNKVMPALNSPTNIAGATVQTITQERIVVLKKL